MGCGIYAAEFERRRCGTASAKLPDESQSEIVRMMCSVNQQIIRKNRKRVSKN
jgi:hypothetical protein